jgi:putative peptidoglycan lipid II flippase
MQNVQATPLTSEGINAPSHRRLLGAAAVIALGNILSRGLGLARDLTIAYVFGATASTDAYVIARALPNTLYDLLVGTVNTAAFVPVFVQYSTDRRQFWRLVGAVFSLAGLAFAGLALILGLAADPLIGVIGSGFSSTDQHELAANLMRIALVSVLFQGLAGVLTSALYAENRFTLPAFATATYNAGIIVAILLLARPLGVTALAVGLVIGALGQFCLQGSGLIAFWRVYRPRIDLADPGVRRILKLAGTVAAGLVVTTIGLLIDRNLASHLPEGNVTSMEYATRLIQFPLGIVGLAVSYAVLPTLSLHAKSASPGDLTNYRAALLFGLKLVLLLMLPALAILAAMPQPIIGVLFQHGAFQAADTQRTAPIFLAYLPQLPLTGVDYLLINAFYARQNARTPVLVGVVCVCIYLVVALSTIGVLGAVGLALANAIQNSSHALILLVLLSRSLPGLRLGPALLPFVVRVVPAAAAAGAIVLLIWPVLNRFGAAPAILVSSAAAFAVYATLLHLVGVPEAHTALQVFRRKPT